MKFMNVSFLQPWDLTAWCFSCLSLSATFILEKPTEDTEEAVSRKGSAVHDFMAYAEKKMFLISKDLEREELSKIER